MFFVRWIGNIAQSYQRSFAILMVGQSIFFVGLALFYLSAEQQMGKPLLAEFLVLLSIIIITVGIAVALVGYLALTYGRWYHFFRKTKKNVAFTKDEDNDDLSDVINQRKKVTSTTQDSPIQSEPALGSDAPEKNNL